MFARERLQRSHIAFKHCDVIEVGFKYNMMDLQAAIGIHQIKRVEGYWQRPLEIWNRYDQAFVDLPLGLPAPFAPNLLAWSFSRSTCSVQHILHSRNHIVDVFVSQFGEQVEVTALTAQHSRLDSIDFLDLRINPFLRNG